MKIERAIMNVKTLGPGNRLAIWTVGCRRNCNGCVSKKLQDDSNSIEYTIEEYFQGFNFKRADGVTISGGEPFEQIDELYHLILFLRDKGLNDILVYTGYTLKELKDMGSDVINRILDNISVLIDGPYIDVLNDQKHNLKGSSNQMIHYLKSGYKDIYEQYIKNERHMQEIIAGNILIGMGIPDKEYIEKFKK